MNLRSSTTMLALVFSAAGPCGAATLHVGPQRTYRAPSAAAAAVHDGDTVMIDAGTYTDCAVWQANGLTIVGAGREETVIGGTSCEGKGAAMELISLRCAFLSVQKLVEMYSPKWISVLPCAARLPHR